MTTELLKAKKRGENMRKIPSWLSREGILSLFLLWRLLYWLLGKAHFPGPGGVAY